jgi:cytochrome c-type biogenesis protein CcmH
VNAFFWVFAAALLAVVLPALLRPLLAARAQHEDDRMPVAAATRARLAELDRDVATGSIAEADARSVRLELERELLQIIDAPADRKDALPARRMAFAVGILVPLFAITLYLFLGDREHGPAGLMGTQPQSPEQMVEQLAARMADNPDDARGWDMLARSYMVLGRHREAVQALQRLQTLRGESPELMVRLADALSREAGGTLAGRPTELVEQALAVDPHNRAGLWLAGMIALEKGDAFGALGHWKELLTLLDPSDPARPKLEEFVRRAEAEIRK